MALILKDLNDKAYPVEAVTNHTTKMNSDGMLTFTIYENSQTKYFINDIAKLWRVENITGISDSQVYVVVIAKRKALKDKQTVEITAMSQHQKISSWASVFHAVQLIIFLKGSTLMTYLLKRMQQAFIHTLEATAIMRARTTCMRPT